MQGKWLRSLGALALAICASPLLAQPFNSTATPEIGHDLSPTLQSMANNVKTDQTCIQQPATLLPNSTGLTLDKNFCGFSPAPITFNLPSDDSGAAGPNHYFQTENFSAVIFDKTGKVVLGPFLTQTFWSNFSSPSNTCSAFWTDVVVLYDHDAQRWFVTRFASVVPQDPTIPPSWYQCFAVSTTSDPTGPYNRYVFPIDPANFSDYPKFGVWPDAYYMTSNNRGNSRNPVNPFGHFVVAFERSAMLAGQAAREILFKVDNKGLMAEMLPADWDGKTPPPAGSPNYLARPLDTNMGWPQSAMEVWNLKVDWGAGTGILSIQNTLMQDSYNTAICNKSQNCIPQPGTAQGLDPLARGTLMNRLAYRNFGDHESLVANETVDVGDFTNHAGIRWYELRRSGGDWSIFQHANFAPDSEHRWVGSLAMDRFGNTAMGYSVSSSATFPEIRIAGRLANDPLGQMSEAAILEPGFGVQLQTVTFEDYSQMTLDPLDDCTFWYTGTYQPANSFGTTPANTQFLWGTKVGSFRFPNCVADLSITKTRSPSGAISAGTNVTYTVTATNNGPADAGNLTVPDTLASGTGFVSLSPPAGWTCTTPAVGQSGLMQCKATSLANGASAVFTSVASVSCSVTNGTVISDTAKVSAQTPPDNNQSNNSQTVSFTVSNPVPVVNAAVALSLLPQNNHDLVNVGLTATATDGSCPTSNLLVQVFGNEADVTPDGPFSPDAKDIAVGTLRLREERDGTGSGRVYLIVVKASNAAGETGFATVTVVVPLSSSAADIGSVEMQAAAAKAFADTHNGAPPPGYFVIGNGPVIGPKQ